MPDLSTMAVFLAAVVVLLVIPGPAVLFIVARSIDQGRTAGIVSTLGIAAGTVFHVAAAAFGVSALLVSSALAFNIVKYAGAAYLIYLGIRTLAGIEDRRRPEKQERRSPGRLFREGVIVNLLNPKTALFFFAFLPQFVDISRGSVALQILLLGGIFIVMGILSDGTWALLAGSAGSWLRGHTGFLGLQRYVSGTVFIALGVSAALSGPGKK